MLKVKLHTYEVLTRQIQPPKAVCTSEDLYHYGLPMLAKLEKENPGMKLRLMGLRCTHLVSTKKGDVDFFGRARQKAAENGGPKVEIDDDGWQVWPNSEMEFEEAARQEREEEMGEIERLSQQHEEDNAIASTDQPEKEADYGRYANGFAWRSLLEQEAIAEAKIAPPVAPEQWNCPICSIPQPADERLFNEHIDGCLSRQTIKEIVKEPTPQRVSTPSRDNGNTSVKRKRIKDHEKKPKKAFFS